MKVIALETFSNGIVSMFKGEIREIADGDTEYTALLEEGLVEQYSAGGGGGGVLNVNCSIEQVTQGVTTYTLNKTWKQIHDAFIAGQCVLITTQQVDDSTVINPVIDVAYRDTGEDEDKFYSVGFGAGYGALSLLASTENDYPTFTQT